MRVGRCPRLGALEALPDLVASARLLDGAQRREELQLLVLGMGEDDSAQLDEMAGELCGDRAYLLHRIEQGLGLRLLLQAGVGDLLAARGVATYHRVDDLFLGDLMSEEQVRQLAEQCVLLVDRLGVEAREDELQVLVVPIEQLDDV